MLVEKLLNQEYKHWSEDEKSQLSIDQVIRLAKVRRLIFVSTNIFQEGNVILGQFFATQDQTRASRDYVLQIAASLANSTTSEYSRVLVKSAEEVNLPLREMEIDSAEQFNVYGKLDRIWYLFGTEEFLGKEEVEIGLSAKTIIDQMESTGNSVLYLAQKQPKRLLGFFAFKRRIKSDIQNVLKTLILNNQEIVVLTSLSNKVAKGLLNPLGVHLIHAELNENDRKMIADSLSDPDRSSLFVISDKSQKKYLPKNSFYLQLELSEVNKLIEKSRTCYQKISRILFWKKI